MQDALLYDALSAMKQDHSKRIRLAHHVAEINDQGKDPEFGQWTAITLWVVQMAAGNQGKHTTF
ncbi:hypothetical protein AZH11_24840 [Pseudomonas simiae]|nr:hypothetical protein AZH11_24840 [Pseudomonas simiae]